MEGSLKKKEGDPAKLLESILDGIFVLGLNRMEFTQLKEMFGKQVWTTRAQLSEELGRYLTTTERITAVMLKKEEGAVNANSVKFNDGNGTKTRKRCDGQTLKHVSKSWCYVVFKLHMSRVCQWGARWCNGIGGGSA